MSESVIRRVPLFAALPPDEAAHLAAALPQREIPANTILFREGDYGDRCYIVLRGTIEILTAMGTSAEHLLAVCGPGDLIGEISLLNPDRLRTASGRTRSPIQILELTRADFEALLRRQPMLAFEMLRLLSMRLRKSTNATISDVGNQLTQAYEDLRAAQAQIIEKEKLERDLEVAREIQERMLPRILPPLAEFDFGARMVPARLVGGDFFDFIPLAQESMGIVVADVCGKGVPAALHMALTRSLLRAEASRLGTPKAALQSVNRHLLDMSDAGIFVTMIYGVLNRTRHEFVYVRAGHDLPLLIDARGEIIQARLGRGQPLGIFAAPDLEEQTLAIPRGGTLLLYTDGVTEAMDEQHMLFGVERLQAVVRDSCHIPAQALCDQVLQMVITYRGAAPQHDDITLVAMHAE
jgi:serine phosphatase RsbU (regulator of sigma subunit)